MSRCGLISCTLLVVSLDLMAPPADSEQGKVSSCVYQLYAALRLRPESTYTSGGTGGTGKAVNKSAGRLES